MLLFDRKHPYGVGFVFIVLSLKGYLVMDVAQIPYYIENSQTAFFIGSLVSHQTVYLNPTAKDMFDVSAETCDFSKIFGRSEHRIEEIIKETMGSPKSKMIYDIPVRMADGQKILVDLLSGFYDKEKTLLYLELIPQNTGADHLVIHQVRHSPRAEAILTLDHFLTIEYSNPHFYRLFGASRLSDLDFFQQKLVYMFQGKEKEGLISKIHEGIRESETFSIEIEVLTLSGGWKWLALDFQRRIFENGEEKLICYAVDIEDAINGRHDISLLNQYLSVMQESTEDILYRLDIVNNVMYYFSDDVSRGNVIPNYLDVFIQEDVVHPEDKEIYLFSYQAFHETGMEYPVEIRFCLTAEGYQWYKITGKRIFDQDGNLVEVFGAFVNVQNEYVLEEKFQDLTQYFRVFQELTEDILYRVDVETKTMYHLVNFDILGIEGTTVPNFLETFIEKKLVHPEDVARYRKFDEAWMDHGEECCKVRLTIRDGIYEWYKIQRKNIYDDQGKVVEILGKMSNIQKEQDKLQELSTLNQFFTAMQEMDKDVVYRIDVPTMTLHFKKRLPNGGWEEREIPDYFNQFQRDDTIHPDDRERYVALVKDWFDGKVDEEGFHCQVRYKLVSDDYLWYDSKGKKIYDSQGNFVEVYGKLVNIDRERVLQSDYTTVNQYFTAMQELSEDKLFHVDIQSMTFYQNDANALDFGLPSEIPDFIETFIREKIIHPDCTEQFREDIRALLRREKMDYKVQLLVGEEKYEWFHVHCQCIYHEKAEPVEIFGKMQNIQKRMELEDKAYYDQLTRVYRRVAFQEEVCKVIAEDRKGTRHALVIIDMDDFKTVNDTYGHQFGDFVLEKFAERINNCIRESDFIGRLGGDEFMVFFKGMFTPEMALNRAETMLDRLKPPFSNGKFTHRLGASIGIAIIPDEGTTYEELYHQADQAVYVSKKQGKNCATVYSKKLE